MTFSVRALNLADIVLLSTTGHGLYLSVAMEHAQQKAATLALMCSLLLSGAIGTWISIGGTYYLISMAFSAANMFVLTRLVGGLAFTLAGCLLGFIVIAIVQSVEIAAIFFVYLFGLTTYLTVLAVLSTYQIPGSSFLNGRRIIIMVVPTLTISPVLTIFIKDLDIYIYPCILYIFVSLLILGTRHVATQWVTWYHDIKTLNDADVKDWFVQRYNQRERACVADQVNCTFITADQVGAHTNVSQRMLSRMDSRRLLLFVIRMQLHPPRLLRSPKSSAVLVSQPFLGYVEKSSTMPS
jgi:hypothetical protein